MQEVYGIFLAAQIGLLNSLILQQLMAGAGGHDLTGLQNVGAVGDGQRLFGVLLHQQNGGAVSMKLLHNVKNLINQEVMETDTLYWNQETEMIYTHCYVRIISPDGFAQGYGMEADQRARSYTLFNNFNNYAFVVKDSTEVLIDSVNFIGPFPKK